jgi:hypothetical protein
MQELRCAVDLETRRRKQQKLILELLEKRIRARAQQLFEQRRQSDGTALEDWIRAEREILKKNALAPLYRRSRGENEPSNSGRDS